MRYFCGLAATAFAVFALLPPHPLNAQQGSGPPAAPFGIAPVSSGKSPSAMHQDQAALIADSNKLAALVDELRAELRATNGETLSVKAVKKAEEIEKLSRSMKKRLSS